jgi:hypothetical protein
MLKVQTYKKLDIRTAGTESRIAGSALHCIYLDYDNIVGVNVDTEEAERRLTEELKDIIHEFQVGNFYVFETRNTCRHAVCIDALRFRDVKEIVDFSSCDIMFKLAPRYNEYRSWVLRFDTKGNRPAPKYLYTVDSEYEGINLQSLGHAKFLEKFGLKIELKNPYGSEEIGRQKYSTTDKHKEILVEQEN